MQDVTLIVDHQKISAQLFKPRTTNGAGLIFLHGWMSSKESTAWFAEKLAEQGFTTLIFDFRGMGQSEGNLQQLTRRDYLVDCLAAYDFLISQPDVQMISIVGVSFGGYMAPLVTQYRSVREIAMRAPANYPDEDVNKPQIVHSTPADSHGWETDINQRARTRAVKALELFSGDILLVESENDTTIHPLTVQTFHDAAQKSAKLTYKILKGAPHSISGDKHHREAYLELLVSWIKASVETAI